MQSKSLPAKPNITQSCDNCGIEIKSLSLKTIPTPFRMYSDGDIEMRIERDSQYLNQLKCQIDDMHSEYLISLNDMTTPPGTNAFLEPKSLQLRFDSFTSHKTIDQVIQLANKIHSQSRSSNETNIIESIINEEVLETNSAEVNNLVNMNGSSNHQIECSPKIQTSTGK